MKKFIVAFVLLVSVSITTFANDKEGVSEKVLTSFRNDFSAARDVKWESGKEFVKATFTLNGQVMFAYYAGTGDLLAVTRNIISAQLPINLLADLKKGYQEYWITDLFEMAADSNTSYYVSLASADYNLVLKSTGANGWEVFKKEKNSTK